MATKLDLYKTHKTDYYTGRAPRILTIGRAQYLALDGVGDPGGDGFQAAVGALYSMAFTVKMARKKTGKDYAVCKLEGLFPDVKDARAQFEGDRRRLLGEPPQEA